MESVSDLRARLRIKQIADRLVAHEPRSKVARDLNLRPNQLQEILISDLFLAYLDEQKSPLLSELSAQIREEISVKEESDAEKLILEAEADATRELLVQMRTAEKPADRRAAAIAIIELARKTQASRKDNKSSQKMDIPASQRKVLLEAAREMDESPKPVRTDDEPGAAVQPVL